MVTVAAFYRFVDLPDHQEVAESIHKAGQINHLLGTVIVAPEGINSTLCGDANSIESFFTQLSQDQRLANLEVKYSTVEQAPFHRWKVKLKPEIVSLGMPEVKPNQLVGDYVDPKNWNDLISQSDVTLIDCRNSYEIEAGTFRGAKDPHTNEFNEFPAYINQNLPNQSQKIAMFCTGGIRCEKATALMRSLGYQKVYHLRGGILKYLEEIPADQSLFQGDCFVFDDRRTVDQNLTAKIVKDNSEAAVSPSPRKRGTRT
jgi:UPF0176 protein